MTELNQVYRCQVCENIVEVVHPGIGELVCCGQPMELLEERNKDTGAEKHVPVMEKTESGVKVKIGSIPHPMEEDHYIEWIEIMVDGAIYKKFLKPGDGPEAVFEIDSPIESITARDYCNIHGLWISS
ncbi:MAG: desulfoferrodoxin [Methanobacteriaceae archaeon]|jgi:superoxide reductase|nr:MAG: desulfoferrodoxin [Methanobacterium sp. BRmetb2]MCC7557128.1 desulfoferrodoxin [Methanobacteriaceae archaeon]